jgi:hypothetical protein
VSAALWGFLELHGSSKQAAARPKASLLLLLLLLLALLLLLLHAVVLCSSHRWLPLSFASFCSSNAPALYMLKLRASSA